MDLNFDARRLPRRPRAFAVLLMGVMLWGISGEIRSQPSVTVVRLTVQTQADAPVVRCTPPRSPAPRAPSSDPLEMPAEEEIREVLGATPPEPSAEPIGQERSGLPLARLQSGESLKVALWGDSHFAAGFFTEELVRLLGFSQGAVRTQFLPATLARSGVRLPVRTACASSEWQAEPAYYKAAAAQSPAPGLVSMVAAGGPRAELALDLRPAQGVASTARTVRLLYQAPEGARVSVEVDSMPGHHLSLEPQSGPAAIELAASSPISTVRLRLLQGGLRFQGVESLSDQEAPLQLDVFGYPGATAASWKSVNAEQLSAWFSRAPYDVVMLGFGTNEGADRRFDAQAYRAGLAAAIQKLKSVFPLASCVLIGPGDRGVLVRRSSKASVARASKAAKSGKGAKTAKPTRGKSNQSERRPVAARPNPALLTYSLVHSQIAKIQQEEASAAGCIAWNAFEAMGGPGSAYRWRLANPPLMASDLIHFTAQGYRRLSQLFVRDLGWVGGASSLEPAGQPREHPSERAASPGSP